jgi:hypothetical protein
MAYANSSTRRKSAGGYPNSSSGRRSAGGTRVGKVVNAELKKHLDSVRRSSRSVSMKLLPCEVNREINPPEFRPVSGRWLICHQGHPVGGSKHALLPVSEIRLESGSSFEGPVRQARISVVVCQSEDVIVRLSGVTHGKWHGTLDQERNKVYEFCDNSFPKILK